MAKILLHCCCAPCSLSCIGYMDEDITLFWHNPNIHPWTEYKARRDCLLNFAEEKDIPLIIKEEYGLRTFISAVPFEDREKRCHACYHMRIDMTAKHAAEKGYDAFSTTLLSSIYQQHGKIKESGERAAEKYGVRFHYKDFRPHFREGNDRARAMGLYMQKYCGCIFSEEERYRNKIDRDKKRFSE